MNIFIKVYKFYLLFSYLCILIEIKKSRWLSIMIYLILIRKIKIELQREIKKK